MRKVNELIARGRYGRLFAVVHFASHQWKVTAEDLILIENELDLECGERIRLEKVRFRFPYPRRWWRHSDLPAADTPELS